MSQQERLEQPVIDAIAEVKALRENRIKRNGPLSAKQHDFYRAWIRDLQQTLAYLRGDTRVSA